MNLRGVRESGLAFMVPTYLFIVSLLLVLAIGTVKAALAGGHPEPVETPAPLPAVGTAVTLWILMRSFSSGCTAMTGVEAISNGVSAFRDPAVVRARRTLTAIIVLLAVMLIGIAYLCRAYRNRRDAARRSRLPEHPVAVDCRGRGPRLVLLRHPQLGARRAGSLGKHRVCRLSAAVPGDCPGRLLAEQLRASRTQARLLRGILVLATLSAAILDRVRRRDGPVDPAVCDRGVPGVYAVAGGDGRTLAESRRTTARSSMGINAAGAVCTAVTLVVVLVSKFVDGAWITALIIPVLLALFASVRNHYQSVARELASTEPLDVCDLRPP